MLPMGNRIFLAPAFLATRKISSRLRSSSMVPDMRRMPGIAIPGVTGRPLAAEHGPPRTRQGSPRREALALQVAEVQQVIALKRMQPKRHALGAIFKEAERRLHGVLHVTTRTHALRGELEVAPHGAVLELEDGHLAVVGMAECEHVAGQQRAIGHQGILALLRNGDHTGIHRVVHIHITQVDVDKLNPGHDLELLLYAAAPLDGVLEHHTRVFLGHALVGEQNLGHAAERLAHADLVAAIEVAIQAKVLIEQVRVVALTHLTAELAQAVGDRARNGR